MEAAMRAARILICAGVIASLLAVGGRAAASPCSDAFRDGLAKLGAAATAQHEIRRLMTTTAAASTRLHVSTREVERRKAAAAAFERARDACDVFEDPDGPRPSELQTLINRNKTSLRQAHCRRLGFQAWALIDDANAFQKADALDREAIRDRFALGYGTLKRSLMPACPDIGERVAMRIAKIEHHALSLIPMAGGADPAGAALQTLFRSAVQHYETQDYKAAARQFTAAAKGGHARAQYYLGRLYLDGAGVRRNDDLALRWFKKSASQGDPAGQNGLGLLYDLGRGVEEDDATAVVWYRRAANQGLAFAQTNLGQMYEDGSGVPRNLTMAVKLYKSAADRGHMRAVYRLGRVHELGLGVKKDVITAIMFYQRAADRGYKPAQQALAEMGD